MTHHRAEKLQIRHDNGGYYLCSHEEGAFEDKGNPSVGFDGRAHYATLKDAIAAQNAAFTGAKGETK